MSESGYPESDCIAGAPHPRRARQLVGHDGVQRAFMTAVRSKRVHHAWMLSGPKGIGKATLAWRIASYLLTSASGPDADPDSRNETGHGRLLVPPPDVSNPVFSRILALSDPDLFLCRRTWNEKRQGMRPFITVDEIRRLRSHYSQTSANAGWRITIIDAVDDMNPSAANALLKLLEEPPERALFLLVCHQPALIIPTIRSRCSKLSCRPLNAEQVGSVLSGLGCDPEDRHLVALAELSDGSPGTAVQLLDSQGVEIYGDIVRILSGAPGMDRALVYRLADSCSGRNNEHRFDIILRLLAVALARLARFSVLGAENMTESVPGEKQMWSRLSQMPGMASRWAELAQELPPMGRGAATVNLDPASIILDMLSRINAAARHAPA